jgi:TET-Associated Glycosyltransferase
MTRLVPQFPVYIPSKSRATIATTPQALRQLGVPCRIIVEESQYSAYRDVYGASSLLVLPREYQDSYDTGDDLGDTKSKGPGPARNFAWEHAISDGYPWHWVMDDNIMYFARLHNNRRNRVGDSLIFAAMEDFVLRYKNIGQAGPEYLFFVKSRSPQKHPFVLNRRIMSCNLIRNDVPVRWRLRYNEDVDLAIQMLYAGWCTVAFRTFLQHKLTTQRMPGGNTEAFYAAEGTRPKSEMLVRKHPDIVRHWQRFGRSHHYVDWSKFRSLRLIRRDGYQPPAENPYRLKLVDNPGYKPRARAKSTARA